MQVMENTMPTKAISAISRHLFKSNPTFSNVCRLGQHRAWLKINLHNTQERINEMDNSTEKEYGFIQNLYCTDQSIRKPHAFSLGYSLYPLGNRKLRECTLIYTRKKARVKFVRNTHPTNQKSERLWKYIVHPIRDTDDSTSLWKATRWRIPVKTKWKKYCQDFLFLKEQ